MSKGSAQLIPLSAAQSKNFLWLESPQLKAVVKALETAKTNSARFVGGCVRDSLFGATPKDFDIATTLQPDDVVLALKAAGLGAAPTGIDHGTITAIVDHQGVEVTTLRADVSTDGRRATVVFTDDWRVDATRRDFTINAIYATPDGHLFDPVGGLKDIEKCCVRFIGNAEDRIREDYLRILRFFRFSARFSTSFDRQGIDACMRLKDGIGRLSAERIGAELTGILALPGAATGIAEMDRIGVLDEVWEQPAAVEIFTALKKIAPNAPPMLGLAALYDSSNEGLGARLRLSNAEKAVRSQALRAADAVAEAGDEQGLRRVLYRCKRDGFFDGLRLALARKAISQETFDGGLKLMDGWKIPEFPFSGKDVVAAGVKPGPKVSAILERAEQQWIFEDFPSAARAKTIFEENLREVAGV